MRRSVHWLMLLLAAVLMSCAPATATTPAQTVTPTATPPPVGSQVVTPAATATPTPVGGGMAPPTSTPPQDRALALEFTEQVSSGYATLHVLAYSCSGLRGPWQGRFELELTFERMQIGGNGSFAFTLPEDGFYVEGEAPYSGGGTTGRRTCVIADVSGPLRYEITFSRDGRSAEVTMGSVGAESITVICADTSVTIPFAIAWGPVPLTVPITHYDGCP